MMLRVATLSAALLLSLSPAVADEAHAQYRPDTRWEIGPIARGRNYSVNMPRHPQAWGPGFTFLIPYPTVQAGHVHYITTPVRSLRGARELRMRFRIDSYGPTRFIPQEDPDKTATVSLYFQRRGDNWSGRGRYLYYRWFAPSASVKRIAPGEHEMIVRLDDPNWITALGGRRSGQYRAQFDDALRNADNVGILFGSLGRRGHGVFATGPARFTMTDFQIR